MSCTSLDIYTTAWNRTSAGRFHHAYAGSAIRIVGQGYVIRVCAHVAHAIAEDYLERPEPLRAAKLAWHGQQLIAYARECTGRYVELACLSPDDHGTYVFGCWPWHPVDPASVDEVIS